jgi:hypothetical protein
MLSLDAVCTDFMEPNMTTFDERENAFEEKYVYEEQVKFKAKARRDKLLGLWAAERLGKSGTAAQDYAARLVVAEVEKDSAGRILQKIRFDFDAAGIDVPDREIHKKMDELFAAAIKEITKGKV